METRMYFQFSTRVSKKDIWIELTAGTWEDNKRIVRLQKLLYNMNRVHIAGTKS